MIFFNIANDFKLEGIIRPYILLFQQSRWTF